jgi:hypothetical protein
MSKNPDWTPEVQAFMDATDWVDEFGVALGFWCGAKCGHGDAGCSLPPDHDGDHESHGMNHEVLCTWPRDER